MNVAVLGSLNMDLVVEVDEFPRPGQTVPGRCFAHYPGGKGQNQAVAAHRLGAKVEMFGRVGDDNFGRELLAAFQAADFSGVDITWVERVANTHTGVALIMVDKNGQNEIAYAPGANGTVDEAYVERVLSHLLTADVILLQLEVPLAPLSFLLRALPEDRPIVILDPAPAQDLAPLPLGRVDFLTPNQEELATLVGWRPSGQRELEYAAQTLLSLGVRHLVVKAGRDGAFLVEKSGVTHFPACPVPVVDTTAAGDAFNAALGCMLAQGTGPYEAIGYANAAAGVTITRKGAVPSLPTRDEVLALLRRLQGGN